MSEQANIINLNSLADYNKKSGIKGYILEGGRLVPTCEDIFIEGGDDFNHLLDLIHLYPQNWKRTSTFTWEYKDSKGSNIQVNLYGPSPERNILLEALCGVADNIGESI